MAVEDRILELLAKYPSLTIDEMCNLLLTEKGADYSRGTVAVRASLLCTAGRIERVRQGRYALPGYQARHTATAEALRGWALNRLQAIWPDAGTVDSLCDDYRRETRRPVSDADMEAALYDLARRGDVSMFYFRKQKAYHAARRAATTFEELLT